MTTYRNPILSGFYPDPSVCRVSEEDYLVTSTIEYFPAIPVFHSRDLVHWRQVGHAVSRPELLDLTRATCLGGIFAKGNPVFLDAGEYEIRSILSHGV